MKQYEPKGDRVVDAVTGGPVAVERGQAAEVDAAGMESQRVADHAVWYSDTQGVEHRGGDVGERHQPQALG